MKHPLYAFLQKKTQPYTFQLDERVPFYISSPCQIKTEWNLEHTSEYDPLTIHVEATLTIHCQRCGEEFSYPFNHTFALAIFRNEQMLKQHSNNQYDCILFEELPDSLIPLLTDELYLSVPDKHSEDQCSTLETIFRSDSE